MYYIWFCRIMQALLNQYTVEFSSDEVVIAPLLHFKPSMLPSYALAMELGAGNESDATVTTY